MSLKSNSMEETLVLATEGMPASVGMPRTSQTSTSSKNASRSRFVSKRRDASNSKHTRNLQRQEKASVALATAGGLRNRGGQQQYTLQNISDSNIRVVSNRGDASNSSIRSLLYSTSRTTYVECHMFSLVAQSSLDGLK
jgi:hypothetical protein